MVRLPHNVTLKKKSESLFHKLIGAILSVFGVDYMRFWTTIDHTIYVPDRYDSIEDWGSQEFLDRHEPVLTHELIHVEQAERWTYPVLAVMYTGPALWFLLVALLLFVLAPWIGPLWAVSVLIVAAVTTPLSLGLAWGRWRVEREAYLYNIKHSGRSIEQVVSTLWRNYLWTWPKGWMRSWFEENSKVD